MRTGGVEGGHLREDGDLAGFAEQAVTVASRHLERGPVMPSGADFSSPIAGVQTRRLTGGFSGADVFRVTFANGVDVVAKCWPAGTERSRVYATAALAQRLVADGFDCIAKPLLGPIEELGPREELGRSGEHAAAISRVWHVETYQSGVADFWDCATTERAANIGRLMARLHLALAGWSDSASHFAPCKNEVAPVLLERLDRIAFWERQRNTKTLAKLPTPYRRAARRAFDELPELTVRLRQLAAERRSRVTHVCLRDLWHASVLWSGNRVSGLIDLGAARVDDPTGDLSRLFGSLFLNDTKLWTSALEAYESVRILRPDDHGAIRCLVESEVSLTTLHWCNWIARNGDTADARAIKEATARLSHYMDRSSAR